MTIRLKSAIQGSVRSVHALLCDRGLPNQLGIFFHSIDSADYPAFQDMILSLRKHGYSFCDPDTFCEESDERRVCISFDDNYRAWYDVLPLLEALDVKVTFFVNTCCFRDRASETDIAAYYDRLDFDGPRVPLSTSELRDLHSAGHTIGAHTHWHQCLTKIPESEAQADIRRGKAELEAVLGQDVAHFSYPYGMRRFFSEPLRNYCRELGFRTVSNAIPGILHSPQSAFHLNRTLWHLDQPVPWNLQNLSIDGRHFEALTGRSAIG